MGDGESNKDRDLGKGECLMGHVHVRVHHLPHVGAWFQADHVLNSPGVVLEE